MKYKMLEHILGGITRNNPVPFRFDSSLWLLQTCFGWMFKGDIVRLFKQRTGTAVKHGGGSIMLRGYFAASGTCALHKTVQWKHGWNLVMQLDNDFKQISGG